MNVTDYKVKYSEFVRKIARALPLWAWMIIAIVTGSCRNLFIAEMTFNSLGNLFAANIASFVVMLILMGVAYGLLARVAARIVYSFGSRIYFKNTAFVPDYNLRRLPMGYNEFCAVFMFLTSVYNVFAVAFNLLMYVAPTAYYLWVFLSNLFLIASFVAGWFVIRGAAEDWQVKRLFIALGIPASLIMIICVLGGV
ncbi:MAG: hypothetical protein IJS93_00520 [Clostridia bacterium]|nr:hypothetical protein [Clostridia bacterium]